MPVLKRATENTFSETQWLPIPEGLYRFVIGTPTLKVWPSGDHSIDFPLELTEAEKERVKNDHGEPAEGEMQSWRTKYTPGLTLGNFKAGVYQSTKLVDFLCFALGTESAKHMRKFFEAGGGPPRPVDLDDQQAELEAITDWLKWWEGLEIYGTVRHEDDKKVHGRKWARFSGPMPVGSIPGQKDADYQAHGRGKLRAIIAESGETREANAQQAKIDDRPVVQFTPAGVEVEVDGELPF